jgi:antitoxin component of MazEF toxin-antitoxin module
VRFANRLVRNGNSTQVTVPARALEWLQWRAGDPIVVELQVDRTLLVRRPTADDLRVASAPGVTIGLLPEAGR